MRVVRLIYNLVFPFALVILLPGFILRMFRRGKYRHKFGQRFGIYSSRVREKLAHGGWTWVHAVSVGEVLIALKLIRALKLHEPDLQVVLSTTTSTGFALASQEKSDWLEAIYNPIDFYWTARRAIRLIRPRRMILVEAEVWPNLTSEAKALGARLALVNTRLSARSESRYRLIRFLAAPLFNQLDALCVQEERDAQRLISLGVRSEKIHCTGSIKFDDASAASPPKNDVRGILRTLGVPDEAPLLLAASTHAGEEALVGSIFQKLRRRFPKLFYISVPRHAERGPSVAHELRKLGLRVALRQGESTPDPDTLIINTTGELRDWYPIADVVFVGKSLLARGGQNPAEAISAGRPVIIGPHMQNFGSLVDQLVRDAGALQIQTVEELEAAIADLLANPGRARLLAANGAHSLATHRNATERTIEVLRSLDRRG